jgi:GrpB-like predicted nucleotidyltransferase (UPF0157 family)
MSERVFFQPVSFCRAKVEALFARVEGHLHSLLPAAHIEHVGSTALPDGLTKGDLDIQVRLQREDYDAACRVLSALFEDNPGGFTEQGRSFKDASTDPPLGIHVTIIDGPSDTQSRQRDLLRERPDLRAQYEALKKNFDGGDMDEYRRAKDSFFSGPWFTAPRR